jgi:hypothetical protein
MNVTDRGRRCSSPLCVGISNLCHHNAAEHCPPRLRNILTADNERQELKTSNTKTPREGNIEVGGGLGLGVPPVERLLVLAAPLALGVAAQADVVLAVAVAASCRTNCGLA